MTLTGRAPAPCSGVEGETPGRVAARLRLRKSRVEAPYLVPDAKKRSRHGPRSASNRRLIDRERAADPRQVTFSRLRTARLDRTKRVELARLVRDETKGAAQRRVEDLSHERALARPAHARDNDHSSDGHAERYLLQIVRTGSRQLEEARRIVAANPRDSSGVLQRLRRR